MRTFVSLEFVSLATLSATMCDYSNLVTRILSYLETANSVYFINIINFKTNYSTVVSECVSAFSAANNREH